MARALQRSIHGAWAGSMARQERKASQLRVPYTMKCAPLRTKKWTTSKTCGDSPPNKKCTIILRTPPVCSAEKVSVENEAISASHNTVGNHGITFRQNEFETGC